MYVFSYPQLPEKLPEPPELMVLRRTDMTCDLLRLMLALSCELGLMGGLHGSSGDGVGLVQGLATRHVHLAIQLP